MTTIEIETPEITFSKNKFKTFDELFFEFKKIKKREQKENLWNICYWDEKELENMWKVSSFTSNSF